MRRNVAELIFLVYIQNEKQLNVLQKLSKNLIQDFLHSISERLEKDSLDSIPSKNQEYLKCITKIFLELFQVVEFYESVEEIKDLDLREFARFLSALTQKIKYLGNVFSRDTIEKWARVLKRFNLIAQVSELLDNRNHLVRRASAMTEDDLIDSMRYIEDIGGDTDHTKNQKTTAKHVWRLAMNRFYKSKKDLIKLETAVLANSILRINSIFPKDLRDSYAFDFSN